MDSVLSHRVLTCAFPLGTKSNCANGSYGFFCILLKNRNFYFCFSQHVETDSAAADVLYFPSQLERILHARLNEICDY